MGGGEPELGPNPLPPDTLHSAPQPGRSARCRCSDWIFFFFVIGAHHYPHTPIPGLSRHRRHPNLAESSPFIAPQSQTLRPGSLPGPSRDTMQRRRGASTNVPRGGGAGTPPPSSGTPLPSSRSPPFLGRTKGHREAAGSISPPVARPVRPPPQVPLGVPGRIGGPLQACREG